MKIIRNTKVINIPKIKILRRKTVDITPAIAKLEGQYISFCTLVIPILVVALAGWKAYEIVKGWIQ